MDIELLETSSSPQRAWSILSKISILDGGRGGGGRLNINSSSLVSGIKVPNESVCVVFQSHSVS